MTKSMMNNKLLNVFKVLNTFLFSVQIRTTENYVFQAILNVMLFV